MSQHSVSCAILFADIVGSTRLYEQLGDTHAQRMIVRHMAVLTAKVQRFGGTVVKTIGDEVMSIFPTANAAVEAACEMHERIAEEATSAHHAIAGIRVGLHFGHVLQKHNDVFGDAVNTAARTVEMAKPYQIMTTGETIERLRTDLRSKVRFLDRATLKGKQHFIDLYEVIWQREDATRILTNWNPLELDAGVALSLRFHNRDLHIERDGQRLSIGRSEQNDLVIKNRRVSRFHACFERRRDKFIFVDQSTNGTYLVMNGERPICLRRDEVHLSGTGWISIGQPVEEDDPDSIHYEVTDTHSHSENTF
jgi:adenylate cyclase